MRHDDLRHSQRDAFQLVDEELAGKILWAALLAAFLADRFGWLA